MFRFVVLALLVALSHAFMAPVAPAAQRSSIVMQEGRKAPKSGWSLTMGGGQMTVEDIYKAQEKAKKSYEKSAVGGDGESDLSRYQKGWTTK